MVMKILDLNWMKYLSASESREGIIQKKVAEMKKREREYFRMNRGELPWGLFAAGALALLGAAVMFGAAIGMS